MSGGGAKSGGLEAEWAPFYRPGVRAFVGRASMILIQNPRASALNVVTHYTLRGADPELGSMRRHQCSFSRASDCRPPVQFQHAPTL
jgi:hypothetical protein